MDTSAPTEQIHRINDLQNFIRQQMTHFTEFGETLVRHFVNRITIRNDRFPFGLNFGISIAIER